MTAKVVLQTASRSRWLARRRKGITATDVPIIFGYSGWATPVDVWLEKTRTMPARPTSWAMQRGNLLEAGIAAQWAQQNGAILEKPPLLVAHPQYPWLMASLDYLGHLPDRTVVVEVKATTRWQDWADGWTPDAYAVQVLAQLAVTGLDEGVLVADVNGRIETRTVPRDRVWEDQAIPMLAEFWHHNVLGAIPPDPDPIRDYPHMNRIWNVEPGAEVEADTDTADAVAQWLAMAPAHRDQQTQLDTLRGRVRIAMGEAQYLTIGGHRFAALDKRGYLTIRAPREMETAV
jgi:putative phage-type endonuclease